MGDDDLAARGRCDMRARLDDHLRYTIAPWPAFDKRRSGGKGCCLIMDMPEASLLAGGGLEPSAGNPDVAAFGKPAVANAHALLVKSCRGEVLNALLTYLGQSRKQLCIWEARHCICPSCVCEALRIEVPNALLTSLGQRSMSGPASVGCPTGSPARPHQALGFRYEAQEWQR